MTSICRIIDALFRDPDDTVAAARLDIACTETGVSIEVGPHPGFTDGSMVVAMSLGAGDLYELEFRQHSDARDARALAAALNAWADWADEGNKRKEENT